MQLYSQPPLRSFAPTVIPDDVPVYRIAGKGFYGVDSNGFDVLFEPGTIIAYEDEPNKDMEPLNKLAMDRLNKFFDKIDKEGRKVAEKTGKSYISHSDAFRNAYALSKDDAKGVRVLNGRSEPPILGGKKRGRPKAAATKLEIKPQETPEIQMTASVKKDKDAVNSRDKL